MTMRICVLVSVIALAFGSWMSDRTQKSHAKLNQGNVGSLEPIDSEMLRYLGQAQLPAIVDGLWIGALQDSSSERSKNGDHPAMYFRLRAAAELDPGFFDAYYTGANILAIVRNDNLGASNLLKKAQDFAEQLPFPYETKFFDKFWSGYWALLMTAGYVQLFELGNLKESSSLFKKASEQKGAPEFLKALGQELSSPGGYFRVGLRVLRFLKLRFQASGNEKAVREVEQKEKSLFLSEYLFHLNRRFKEFLGQMADYRASLTVSNSRLKSYWKQYCDENGLKGLDPLGGQLFINGDGQVDTTSERRKVMGIRE